MRIQLCRDPSTIIIIWEVIVQKSAKKKHGAWVPTLLDVPRQELVICIFKFVVALLVLCGKLIPDVSVYVRQWLSIRTAHRPPPIKLSSRHPKGVRRSFFDEKLKLFKASFRLYGIKHQIDRNHLYYSLYSANFGLLSQKLPGCLVNFKSPTIL